MKKLFIFIITVAFFNFNLNMLIADSNLPDGVKLFVQPQKGTVNDRFTVQLNLNFEKLDGQPIIEKNLDFQIIGKSQSSQTRNVNGQISIEIAYIFILVPLKEGELTTPNIKILKNGTEIIIPGKKISVEKGKAYNSATKDSNLRLELSSNKLDIYEGEQLYIRTELLTAISIHDIQTINNSFSNAWIEEIEQKPSFSTSKNGKNYRGLRLETILFPNNSGLFKIDPRVLRLKIDSSDGNSRYQNRFGFDPFDIDNIFGRSTKIIDLKSNQLEINVKELPKANEELFTFDNSSIPVGKTSINANLSDTNIKLNENITLTVTIESYGLLNSIKNINLNLPETVKTYVDKPKIEKKIFDNKISYVKTFKISIIPIKQKDFTIPSLKLSYFEPESNNYQITKTNEFKINVNKSSLNSSSLKNTNPNKTQDINLNQTTNNSEFIPTIKLLKEISNSISTGLALLILSFVLLLGILILALFFYLTKPKVKKVNFENIKTNKELYDEFKKIITKKLNLDKNALSDEIRVKAMSSYGESITISIMQTLKSLDADIYGKTDANLEEQKKNVQNIIKQIG